MRTIDVKIRKAIQNGKVTAIVSITIDGAFAVHDIKIIRGAEKLFIAMPSRRDENGVFRDIVHPITLEARQKLEESIFNAYYAYLAENSEGACSNGLSKKI